MHFEKKPETFFVEEQYNPVLGEGKYFYYTLRKNGIDTPNAIKALERQNLTKIFYSGLKDANATTTQWICSEQKLEKPEDKRIEIEYRGKGNKKIIVGSHSTNKFTAILSAEERDKGIVQKIAKTIFPNYFDEQRFSKKNIEITKHILDNDWEKAVHSAMTLAEDFESEKSKEIKKTIKQDWGNWKKLIENEEIPDAKKMVFETLLEEEDWQRAFSMLDRKTRGTALRAGQALLFNKELSGQIEKQNAKNQLEIEIAGKKFPTAFSKKGAKRKISVEKLAPNGVVLERKTTFAPKKVSARFYGKKCRLSFVLPKGCYGTVLLKTICAKDAPEKV